MKKYLSYIPWLILIVGAIIFIRQCGEEPVIEYVPVEIEVLVPSVEYVHDTIKDPVPIYVKVPEIDSTYYEKYKVLKDSVARDSMFKEAIRINEYNEVFEDTLQTIDVYSKTRGKLLEQSVKYTTKPYYITVKDSVAIKKKFTISLGAEVGIPTIPTLSSTPVVKGGIIFKNKRDNTFSISYDTEGRVWLGKSWKIKLRK